MADVCQMTSLLLKQLSDLAEGSFLVYIQFTGLAKANVNVTRLCEKILCSKRCKMGRNSKIHLCRAFEKQKNLPKVVTIWCTSGGSKQCLPTWQLSTFFWYVMALVPIAFGHRAGHLDSSPSPNERLKAAMSDMGVIHNVLGCRL